MKRRRAVVVDLISKTIIREQALEKHRWRTTMSDCLKNQQILIPQSFVLVLIIFLHLLCSALCFLACWDPRFSSVSILSLQTITFTFPSVSSSWNFWLLGFYHSWASWRAALAFPAEVESCWSIWQNKETWASKNLFSASVGSSASFSALKSRRTSLELPGQGKSQQITTAFPYPLWCSSLGVCAHIWLPQALLFPSRPQASWRG